MIKRGMTQQRKGAAVSLCSLEQIVALFGFRQALQQSLLLAEPLPLDNHISKVALSKLPSISLGGFWNKRKRGGQCARDPQLNDPYPYLTLPINISYNIIIYRS